MTATRPNVPLPQGTLGPGCVIAKPLALWFSVMDHQGAHGTRFRTVDIENSSRSHCRMRGTPSPSARCSTKGRNYKTFHPDRPNPYPPLGNASPTTPDIDRAAPHPTPTALRPRPRRLGLRSTPSVHTQARLRRRGHGRPPPRARTTPPLRRLPARLLRRRAARIRVRQLPGDPRRITPRGERVARTRAADERSLPVSIRPEPRRAHVQQAPGRAHAPGRDDALPLTTQARGLGKRVRRPRRPEPDMEHRASPNVPSGRQAEPERHTRVRAQGAPSWVHARVHQSLRTRGTSLPPRRRPLGGACRSRAPVQDHVLSGRTCGGEPAAAVRMDLRREPGSSRASRRSHGADGREPGRENAGALGRSNGALGRACVPSASRRAGMVARRPRVRGEAGGEDAGRGHRALDLRVHTGADAGGLRGIAPGVCDDACVGARRDSPGKGRCAQLHDARGGVPRQLEGAVCDVLARPWSAHDVLDQQRDVRAVLRAALCAARCILARAFRGTDERGVPEPVAARRGVPLRFHEPVLPEGWQGIAPARGDRGTRVVVGP